MQDSFISGSCYCRALRYQIKKDPIMSGVCYCKDCQKLSGGSSWPFLFIVEEAFKLIGSPKSFTRLGASGKNVTCYFCSDCGTTLFAKPGQWPGHITVSASSLDHPELFKPNAQVWVKDAASWQTISQEIPSFEQNPS